MSLDRINGFSTSAYGPYSIPSASDNQITNLNDQLAEKESPKKEETQKGLDLTVSEIPERKNATIENIALSFGGSTIDLFSGKGLASEDMKEAIDGMHRDQILHEYQYFVGGKDLTGKESNIIAGTEDGVVIKL